MTVLFDANSSLLSAVTSDRPEIRRSHRHVLIAPEDFPGRISSKRELVVVCYGRPAACACNEVTN